MTPLARPSFVTQESLSIAEICSSRSIRRYSFNDFFQLFLNSFAIIGKQKLYFIDLIDIVRVIHLNRKVLGFLEGRFLVGCSVLFVNAKD